MKKTILSGIVACVICAPVYASDGGVYGDYNTEMKTTAEDFVRVERVAQPVAVKTVAAKPACTKCNKCAAKVCGEPFEKVVNREYFVRETVQQYRPVVSYVPAGSYTTVRAVATPKCNKCGF
ncbi:MAG: hypothetical protein IJ866_02450 [Alphaproteobacteria bacterium]|nr:hypothetical protein [Alphaproteobacteria bacterium]